MNGTYRLVIYESETMGWTPNMLSCTHTDDLHMLSAHNSAHLWGLYGLFNIIFQKFNEQSRILSYVNGT